MARAPAVQVHSADVWEEAGSDEDPASRLLATIWVEGIPCHLEALKVEWPEDGVQEVADPMFESNFQGMGYIYEGGPFHTTTIEGWEGRYVFNLTPFAH
jgi:hypothetical protein